MWAAAGLGGACAALVACATTSEDGLRPHERSASTYWRALVGTGVPLETALELYGDDFLRFLERETHAVRAALARGAGPVVSDLAHAMSLDAEAVGRLGAKLREHRASVEAPLVEMGPFTPDRVRRLSAALRQAVE